MVPIMKKHLSLILACAMWLAALPAKACDIALVFAVDVSGSISRADYEIQMGGLAQALQDFHVADALMKANARITVIQWTGRGRQQVSLPWTDVSTYGALQDATRRVAATRRAFAGAGTAIGEALVFAEAAFEEVPFCQRRVVDVSSDGRSNEGLAPQLRSPHLAAAGITVNALVIDSGNAGLRTYFEEAVITGAGSFALAVNSWSDYPDRIRQKLIKEISVEMAALERTRPSRLE